MLPSKERGGLRVGKSLGVEEQVAIFVGVLAHHKKIVRLGLNSGDLEPQFQGMCTKC